VLKVTPHADLPEFAITGEDVSNPCYVKCVAYLNQW